VPTRQNSSSGRPKSPRIQVVLPEELCARLAHLAERETRTVSNMAKVLIQQGVERLEAELAPPGVAAGGVASAAAAGAAGSVSVAASATAPAAPGAGSAEGGIPPGAGAEPATASDRFRAELVRHEADQPGRLRGLPRRLRLRPPGG